MTKKSPLNTLRLLRNPGDSSERRIQDIVWDDFLPYLTSAFAFALLALYEWLRWAMNIQPSPLVFTAIATVGIGWAAWAFWKVRRKVSRIRLGRDGERAVGQLLERLRQAGAHIFHDVPGSGFNLDHVVVHHSGVYVIETKTVSKPSRGETKITFDGEHVRINGATPSRAPIPQVRAACRWMSDLLEQSTGKRFPVRPVVVYPGWYVERTPEAKSNDVWVLNPKALPVFIANEDRRLSSEDVSLCSFHLGRYIETCDKELASSK